MDQQYDAPFAAARNVGSSRTYSQHLGQGRGCWERPVEVGSWYPMIYDGFEPPSNHVVGLGIPEPATVG